MKTDWNKIKIEYTEGAEVTLQSLSEKFKVNPVVLRRHAAKENWTEQRKLFQNKVQTLRFEKKSEIMASESAQFDSDSLKLARAGYSLLAEDIKSRKPAKDIAVALANFQKVGKLALGEATDKQETSGHTTISVVSEKAKELTESIIAGKNTI